MHTFAQKQKSTQQPRSASSERHGRVFLGHSSEVSSILHLQHTIGNQAVQRLIQTNQQGIETSSSSAAVTHISHDFSRIPICSAAQTIQTKLAVNKLGDKYEQEADRVADQVMRMPEPETSQELKGIPAVHHQTDRGELIHRLAAHKSPSFDDSTVVEEESEKGTVQTLRAQNLQNGREVVTKQQLNSSQGGIPLGANVRRSMEARFGADFSGVKIHADSSASILSNSLNARAFTYGQHIYFGDREYQPDSQDGKRVLAHELTHVVQQGASQSRLPVSPHVKNNQSANSPTVIQRLSALGRVKRHNVAPWGPGGPTGTDYEVTTDGGSKITGWQAYSPWRQQYRYWCHGHSADSYVNYDYSVYSGQNFGKVVADEWTNISSAATRAGDIAVWTARMDHSAKFTDPVINNGQLVPDRSVLSTKNGQRPLARMTLTALVGVYGGTGIAVYRHK